MCFGGSKTPDIPVPPPPAPTPVPTPSDVSAQTTQQRANVAAQAKLGLMSTIKTSAAGLVGQGADLQTAVAGAGTKKTLGGT